jgi:polysaccharide biosynthesis protein PelE
MIGKDPHVPPPVRAIVCAALAQTVLCWLAADGTALLVVLLAHTGVCAALAWWLHRCTRTATRYDLLLLVTTFAFGPFGPIGVLCAALLERYHARHAIDVEQWHAALFPKGEVDANAALWRRIGQRASDRPAEQRVTPFLDVLTFGSVPQRQAIIAIIAQQFDPAFAPALRAALRDEHNVVRVQAATAIARLENQFLERSLELEAAVRKAPDDVEAALALATHYDNQAFTGLLDSTREQECRVKAVSGYQRYLQQRPDDLTTQFRLARLQLRRGQVADATPRLRELARSGHGTARYWLMESLFAEGRYAELRAVVADTMSAEQDDLSPELASTVELWAGGEEAA